MNRMDHRHIQTTGFTKTAIEDILERGTFLDWAPLLLEIARDPWGPTAMKTTEICRRNDLYGTPQAVLNFVERRRQGIPLDMQDYPTARTP